MTTHSNSINISHFTRFTWWIAGAENSILSKYPTEYSKFSIIGSVILMTFMVAIVSGFSAAYYFSAKVIPSIFFGFFWGLVIFCIDRALVATMKKKLNDVTWLDKVKENVKILIPRFILAILVAFLMSIPLELLVFEDLIQQELPSYKENRLLRANQSGYHAEERREASKREEELRDDTRKAEKRRDAIHSQMTDLQGELSSLESQINTKRNQLNNPNTIRYSEARRQLTTLQQQLSRLNENSLDREAINSRISTQRSIMNSELNIWNNRINQEINSLSSRLTTLHQELETRRKEYSSADERVKESEDRVREVVSKIQTFSESIDSTAVKIGDKIENSNKFIQYYSVLDYAINAKHPEIRTSSDGKNEITIMVFNNPQALVLLWLIRVIFVIFEMMPTVVKAISKPGPYEYAVEAHEQAVKSYLQSSAYQDNARQQMQAALAHEHQLTIDRQTTEKELHSKLLVRIKDAQEEIAGRAIDSWRNEQLKNLNSKTVINSITEPVSFKQQNDDKSLTSSSSKPVLDTKNESSDIPYIINPAEWD